MKIMLRSTTIGKKWFKNDSISENLRELYKHLARGKIKASLHFGREKGSVIRR
jgi:hypothetical protein